MSGLPEKLLLLLALLASVACKPEIGDDCQISTDCSAAGDRLCDITAPGGYCTIYNCEPGSCPEDESLCVQFGTQRSPVAQCEDKQSQSPYARSFCMATCDKNSDCRDGYVCANLTNKNAWNALLIDTDRGGRACLVPVSATPVAENDSPGFGDVCRREPPPAGGSTATGGSTSTGGASGSGGAPAEAGAASTGGVPAEGGAPADGGAAGAGG